MPDSSPETQRSEGLSDALRHQLVQVLASCTTTADVWRKLQTFGGTGGLDTPMTAALRNGLRVELQRREAEDEARIGAAIQEALLTGDLRPYWAAREVLANTSPELAANLFPHEPEEDDSDEGFDPSISREVFEQARSYIRTQIAAIEEAQPTGSMIEAFAVLEDAIEREEPQHREPLKAALEAERRRQSRTARNLLRTRIAIALGGGRSYDHFQSIRVIYADLSAEDRAGFFGRS